MENNKSFFQNRKFGIIFRLIAAAVGAALKLQLGAVFRVKNKCFNIHKR